MNLFQPGKFTLASGKTSNWKIEADALTPDDWNGLAVMAVDLFGHPSEVVGVPRGGIPFADALEQYCQTSGKLWIVDDVLTSGGSINAVASNHLSSEPMGVVAFARGKKPDWVKSIFSMPDWDEADLGTPSL